MADEHSTNIFNINGGKISNIFSEAQKEYLKSKEGYFNNKLHPNHLDEFKAMKKYFKDNTFEIHAPEEKEKRN